MWTFRPCQGSLPSKKYTKIYRSTPIIPARRLDALVVRYRGRPSVSSATDPRDTGYVVTYEDVYASTGQSQCKRPWPPCRRGSPQNWPALCPGGSSDFMPFRCSSNWSASCSGLQRKPSPTLIEQVLEEGPNSMTMTLQSRRAPSITRPYPHPCNSR